MSDISTNSGDLLNRLNLQIRYVAPAKLSAYGRKSRTHSKDQIRKISESIRTFGFTVPVMVDEARRVIAGNARVEAALQLGLETIPVVELSHLNQSEKRAFIIAENQLATLGGWDKEVLKIEFAELSSLDLQFGLEITGFLDSQIDAIILDEHKHERCNSIPAVAAAVTSRPGDRWLLGKHRLLCGNFADSLADLLNGEAPCAVFTRAPEGIETRTTAFAIATDHPARSATDASASQSVSSALSQISLSLAPGGIAYFCIGWRYMDRMFEAVKATELEILDLVVWDQQSGSGGSLYRSRHELVFVLRKQTDKISRVGPRRQARGRDDIWAYPHIDRPLAQAGQKRMMPLTLVRDAILDCTARGDLVLDLFAGYGTTIIAAHDCGRRGMAIDFDPRNVDTGVIRWQDYCGQEAVLASTGQTFREVEAARAAEAFSDILDPSQAGKSPASPSVTTHPPARVRVRTSAEGR